MYIVDVMTAECHYDCARLGALKRLSSSGEDASLENKPTFNLTRALAEALSPRQSDAENFTSSGVREAAWPRADVRISQLFQNHERHPM
ncbi:unnamed protein product [Lampetra fluviatilis]